MKIFLAALLLSCSYVQGMAQQAETAWFGASVDALTKEEAAKLGWDAPHGARVTNLTADSPAEAAGLLPGDILLSFDGAQIIDDDNVTDLISAKVPGAAVNLSIRRAGAEKQISVTLGARQVKRADDSPQLMLDTGGHLANVVDIAVTPDGKQLVSASNDKTIRIWDIATGKTVRMIRGESAPGNWGTIYAMALSPDGRSVAIGGFLSEADAPSAASIHIFDFTTGKLVKVIKGHKDVIFALAYSADGKRLISGSGDKSAIIWDAASGQQIFQLTGHSEQIEAVGFSADGTRAITGGSDETLRLWNATDGKLIAEMTEHRTIAARQNKGDKKIWSGDIKTVAFSPTDRLIASGSEDGRVLLWDAAFGTFMRELSAPGGWAGGAYINSLSFSPDGKSLLYTSSSEGCTFFDLESGKAIWDGKLLDQPGSRYFSEVKRPDCTGGAAFSPDGQLAVASYNGMIQLLDPHSGRGTKTLRSSGATVFATGFAKDGRSIAWGTDVHGERPPLTNTLNLPFDQVPLAGPLRMVVEQVAGAQGGKSGEASPRPAAGADANSPPKPVDEDNYVRRSSKHGALSADFKQVGEMLVNTRLVEILNDGKLQTQIELDKGAGKHSNVGFTPDGQTILINRASEIESYDLSGRRLNSFIGHIATVREFAPSPDGRFLVSGGSDQTVRLWNLRTRELIVSLFYGTDGEWVMWTPQGYYTSSPNGDRIVGWQINRGAEQAAEYVTASQLRNKFYHPDIVERAIVLASATKAVEEVDPGHAGGFQLSDLAQRLPPKLAVLSPRDGSGTSNGRTMVELALAETSGDPVDSFQAFVNDTKVTAEPKRQGGVVTFEVPLGKGNNHIRLVARSKADLLAEAQLDVVQRGDGALDKRNTLFIVAIGADKYPQLPKRCGKDGDAPCDLSFAGADAKLFADTIEKQMGGQHKRVAKRVLVNGASSELEPTRANVENALDMLREARDNDTVAVFIAGHGMNDPQTGYQFLPTDARYGDGVNLASSSVVKWSVLESAIQSAKGRRLLFVDTCRSTNAFNPRLMKDASDEAIVAFSATNTQQNALEIATLGHGVFTSAVVKGLNGAADLAQEQEVRVFDLGAYVEREVRKLTKGLQTPDFYKKPGAENFVLARLSNQVVAVAAADRQNTVSELGASLRDDRPVQPSDSEAGVAPPKPAPAAAAEPKPAPAAAAKPAAAPEVKPAVAPPAAAEVKSPAPAPAAPEVKVAAVPSAVVEVKPESPAPVTAVKPVVAPPPAAEVKPAAPAPAAKPAAPEVKVAVVPPAAAEKKPAGLAISPVEEAERLKSAQEAMDLDDINGARLIFEYLANRGSGAGAYQLARTYDPKVLARMAMGALVKPDAKIAQSWYAKAAELGHAEARKKLSESK